MATLAEMAEADQRESIALTQRTNLRIAELWEGVLYNEIEGSVDAVVPGLVATITASQVQAVQQAERFKRRVDIINDLVSAPNRVVPQSLAGVNWDGVPLQSGLQFASTVMKRNVAAGYNPDAVLQSGYAFASTVSNTAIMDTGRTATAVAAAPQVEYTQYVRQISPGACSRCIVLAGATSWRVAFARHPRCRCRAVPAQESFDGAIETDPRAFFDGLSVAEQNRRFTVAGAEAIRAGADISRVVNARRGATGIQQGPRVIPAGSRRLQRSQVGTGPNGEPIYVYKTTDLTSRRSRGRYQGADGIRLMPESILSMAAGNRERYIALLIRYGYITG